MGAMEILIMLGVAAWLGFWLSMLLEIGRRPDSVYRDTGESKALWFLAVLVFQFFGTLVYYFMAREKLVAADRRSMSANTV